jgi:hypothetical protein
MKKDEETHKDVIAWWRFHHLLTEGNEGDKPVYFAQLTAESTTGDSAYHITIEFPACGKIPESVSNASTQAEFPITLGNDHSAVTRIDALTFWKRWQGEPQHNMDPSKTRSAKLRCHSHGPHNSVLNYIHEKKVMHMFHTAILNAKENCDVLGSQLCSFYKTLSVNGHVRRI